MATFTYLAKQADGRSVSGLIEADDLKQALELLRARQCWVLGIRRQGASKTTALWQRLWHRVKPGPMSLFFSGLLESVKAGISLAEALSLAERTAPHRYLRRAAREMIEPLRSGERLSTQLARRPSLFPSICTQLVRAGEESGHLERMLEVCRRYLEGIHESEQAVKAATFYPKLLVGMAFLLVVGFAAVLAWVQAHMEVSEEAGAVAVGPAVRTFTFLLRSLGTLVAVAVGALLSWRVLSLFLWFRHGFDTLKMYFPGIAGITSRLVYSRFAKTLATCYSAGLPIPPSLEIASDTCGNEMVRHDLRRAVPALQAGAKLSEALGAVAKLPPTVMQVLVTGETTGRLDETLNRAAGMFDREAEAGIKAAIILTGVAAWVIVAVIIAIAVISFWSGYFRGLSNLAL